MKKFSFKLTFDDFVSKGILTKLLLQMSASFLVQVTQCSVSPASSLLSAPVTFQFSG